MERGQCCEQGKINLFRYDSEADWNCYTPDGDYACWFRFCPYCGHDLSLPVFASLEAATASLLTGPPQRICFDVDGVLCDDSDPSVPYDDRPPYPWVAGTLVDLQAAGHTIVIHTARHMRKFDGDRDKASAYGGEKLWFWLNRHSIPHDELHMGKPSADYYLDDRGVCVASNAGTLPWIKFFGEMSAKASGV